MFRSVLYKIEYHTSKTIIPTIEEIEKGWIYLALILKKKTKNCSLFFLAPIFYKEF